MTKPLTREDLVTLFGSAEPPEVLELFWALPGDWTRARFDEEVRKLAIKSKFNSNLPLIDVTIVDTNPAVVDAAKKAGLEAECRSILSEPAPAVVSPANGFGFMDGGIDLAYSRRFGWEVERRVQLTIQRDFAGELLVGQSISTETGDAEIPLLIAAPTMRVGGPIGDPLAVRLATRAAVREALRMKVDAVAIPGMGAGAGNVRPEWVAAMMKAGIEDALAPPPFPETLAAALKAQTETYPKEQPA